MIFKFCSNKSEVNLMRHFSCEWCDKAVRGGFDPSTNQVSFSKLPSNPKRDMPRDLFDSLYKAIMCYNTLERFRWTDPLPSELIGQLIHAYDYCRANFNSYDLKHLA